MKVDLLPNAIGGLNQMVNLEVVPGVTFTSPSDCNGWFNGATGKEKGYEVKHGIAAGCCSKSAR